MNKHGGPVKGVTEPPCLLYKITNNREIIFTIEILSQEQRYFLKNIDEYELKNKNKKAFFLVHVQEKLTGLCFDRII